MTTETPAKTIRFLTKYPNHVLVVSPARKDRQFSDGTWARGNEGKRIEFNAENQYETSDPGEIEFLRSHRLFNQEIWEYGAAPGELRPTISERLAEILAASTERDADEINRIKLEESETHDRAIVIDAAESALRSIAGVPQEV